MAKTLSFTDTSPQTVKIGDTTTSFTLICGNDNVATDLTKATSITAKLGNNIGYLKSATIDPASLTDPTTGQVTVTFNADLMTSLPAGSYAIEVWVVDPTGTSIYPSDGSTGFTITNNIQSANGATITTITFDDFVKELNKAASTIAKGDKGDKGDTGTVDNTGLISAPAFQSLQTQVDNSAVGTNLLTTPFSNSDQTIDDSSNTSQGYAFAYVYKNLIAGSVYAFSSEVSVVGTATSIDVKPFNPVTHGTIDDSYTTFPIVNGKISGLIKPTDGYSTLIVYGGNKGNTHGNKVTFHHMKLEKGSVATDWCPNQTEILTQSDYAKIKAAIVALGGALS